MADPHYQDLSEELIEKIAERAATKAVAKLTDQVYRDVGKTVVQKFMWTVGVVALAGVLYFGKIKSGG